MQSHLQRSLIRQSYLALVHYPVRLAHTPMIQFIGKRTKENKSVGVFPREARVHSQPDRSHSQPQVDQPKASQSNNNDLKPLSPKCEVIRQNDYKVNRLPLSKEEIEIINNGGQDVKDWRKIKF